MAIAASQTKLQLFVRLIGFKLYWIVRRDWTTSFIVIYFITHKIFWVLNEWNEPFRIFSSSVNFGKVLPSSASKFFREIFDVKSSKDEPLEQYRDRSVVWLS